MKRFLLPLAALVICTAAAGASAQTESNKISENNQTTEKSKNSKQSSGKNEQQAAFPTVSIKPNATPLEMAQAALQAHGGDKFANAKTIVARGSVDVTGASFPTLAGTFAMIFSGDRYRLQIQSPVFSFTQTFDGEQTYSSVGNVQIPPVNRLGLPLLTKIETQGFTVSAQPDKKKRGFRITSPEGFTTDFVLDEKTGQVKSYSAAYNINGRDITTAVEHGKFRLVEGVVFPERYSQRFDVSGNTFYADFKIKELQVNSPVGDDVFTLKSN